MRRLPGAHVPFLEVYDRPEQQCSCSWSERDGTSWEEHLAEQALAEGEPAQGSDE